VPGGWKPHGTCYRLEIRPQLEDADPSDDPPVRVEFVFAHTPLYPDEVPLVKARSLRGLSDAQVAELQALVDEQAAANIGMPMIFTLVGAAQEWVDETGAGLAMANEDPEAEIKRLRAAEELRQAELRAHGTPVTPETFREWKARFDAEMALARAAVTDTATTAASTRMTGKQFFMQQETVEEPELGEDEVDWSGSDEEDVEEDFDEDEDEDEDEILEAILLERGNAEM
jgi:hypothetical protein